MDLLTHINEQAQLTSLLQVNMTWSMNQLSLDHDVDAANHGVAVDSGMALANAFFTLTASASCPTPCEG